MFKNLTASFLKLVQWQPQPNNKIQLFYVKFVIHIGPCSIVSPMVSDSNFTLTVHSPKLNQAKTHFLSHLGEKKGKNMARPRFEPTISRSEVDRANHYFIYHLFEI